VQRLAGALRRVGVAGAAGILDHNRDDAEIGGVEGGRLDAVPSGVAAMQPDMAAGFTDIGGGIKRKLRRRSDAAACGKAPQSTSASIQLWVVGGFF
jgi:hypothetical protein